jgi:hypothetical protein
MFRVLYSLLLVPASWSLVVVKNINYNINKEYGNISVNFTEADGGPEVSCNFSIFNDVPKGWVILTDSCIAHHNFFYKILFLNKSKSGSCEGSFHCA